MPANKQDFSSWKFRWIDALMTGVEGRELRIALYLLQRCNAETGLVNPSMQNVAHMLNCSVKTVERAIDRLGEMGVLSNARPSRHHSYRYQFLDQWMLDLLDVRKRLQVEWDAKKLEPRSVEKGPDNSVGSEG